LDDYPITIDPAHLSDPLDVDFTPYFGEYKFGEYKMDPNEAAQTGSPNLARNDYPDFLIVGADRSVTEGLPFLLDNGGDALMHMEDGALSPFLGHSSSHQDPGAPSSEYDLLTYINDSVGVM
jgi:hypothetical protein